MLPTVLFLTDSLAFPRAEYGLSPSGLYTNLFPDEATIVSVNDSMDRLGVRSFSMELRTPRHRIFQVSNAHWDTTDMLSYVTGGPPIVRRPDLAVVHVGIVDCSPRVFRKRTQRWLMRRGVLGPVARITARRLRPQLLTLRERALGGRTVYTEPGRFRANLIAIADGLGAGALALLSIVRASGSPLYRSPGWNEQIDAYNAIVAEVAAVREGVDYLDVNPLLDPPADVARDGFHLTAHGHGVVRGALREWVQRER